MIRNKMKELGTKAQEEKFRRQNSPDIPTPLPSPDDKGGGNSSLDKKITNLQSRIKVLENKIKNNPTSPTAPQDSQELQNLKNELKEKEKEKERTNENQNKKNDFPWPLVIGGGVVITVLLVVIFFLLSKTRKR
jgi:hypothetical protein